ncbi:hypothetical protein GKQ38_02740 [Candidatus Nanohaloarchaea archaeon]|nr:hypothetical protein GKQ38_02740 [Candidatus Nanohaloarchaea archaeon]
MSSDSEDISEQLDEMMGAVGGDDVGQKRFQMYEVLRFAVEKQYEVEGLEVPDTGSRIEELRDVNGYMYKLVQDFLNSSSTLEKERKLEKIVDHFRSKL